MTKPSKGAAAFFIFFGLMFLVPGLLALFSFLANGRGPGTSGVIAGAAIAVFISAIGAGFLLVAVVGYGRLKKQAAVEESSPTSPWLWRTDWANRRAESLRKNSAITTWVACLFCNLVTIPITVTIIPQLSRRNDPRAFLVLGFGLIGVILFVAAVRASLRHRRFGNTYFEFYSLPFLRAAASAEGFTSNSMPMHGTELTFDFPVSGGLSPARGTVARRFRPFFGRPIRTFPQAQSGWIRLAEPSRPISQFQATLM